MNDFRPLYSEKAVLLLNQKILSADESLIPFALTDTLVAYSEQVQQPILHFWQLDQTMILGMKDTRVPHLADALASLEKNHYNAVVRNSGGLGVIADTGTLNVSLILPQPSNHKFTIDEGYIFMWNWIRQAFEQTGKKIEAYEISSSYCPGTFDLSINGKKFAGIAQRRVRNGLAVMAYLSISGDQQARGKTVQEFYHAGLRENFGTDGYPAVNPSVMENLAELLEYQLTIEETKEKLLTAFCDDGKQTIETLDFSKWLSSPDVKQEYQKQLEKMIQRNQQLKEDQNDLFL
ncbi:lipoate--protein ligase family protein [Enterococcus sp. BWR-S5]|uniref:lipoate--protein ligase family protein n=1 Tax=Enterococcus sp. BWR-S5 TaxID=2787714 RepID=UPI001924F7A5|nr:lipoate--protein ligase family protein [Enterococcus sp. BWR-S5]MBL1225108.1 lipoate--protein ligase family protein [Enterococcus sp. BWR-S5]